MAKEDIPEHFTAVIIVMRVTEAHEKSKTDRGYDKVQVPRSTQELAKIEVRDGDLPGLIDKAVSHLSLVTNF